MSVSYITPMFEGQQPIVYKGWSLDIHRFVSNLTNYYTYSVVDPEGRDFTEGDFLNYLSKKGESQNKGMQRIYNRLKKEGMKELKKIADEYEIWQGGNEGKKLSDFLKHKKR